MAGPWHFDLNEAWYLYERPGALKQAFQVAYRPPEPRSHLKKLKNPQFVWYIIVFSIFRHLDGRFGP